MGGLLSPSRERTLHSLTCLQDRLRPALAWRMSGPWEFVSKEIILL